MRFSRISRTVTGPGAFGVVAVAAALPLALAPAARAGTPDGSVPAADDTVHAGARPDGGGAALLTPGRAVFSPGRQPAPADEDGVRPALWPNVRPGGCPVLVMCADGTTAGAGSATVSGAAASPSPVRTSAPRPSRTVSPAPTAAASAAPWATGLAVRGGLGGGSPEHGAVTTGIGATLVVGATGGGTWFLNRRRGRP